VLTAIMILAAVMPGWADPPAHALADARLRNGRARVIVEFADPDFAPGVRERASVSGPSRSARDRDARRRRLAHSRERLENKLGPQSLRRARRFADLPLLAIDADASDLAAMRGDATVVAVHPDRLHRPSLDQSVPWIGGDETHPAGLTGSGATIAVLDSGVDASHPAFSGRIVAEACYSAGGDCPGGQTSATGPGSGTNCSFSAGCIHGTHVAGIAAGADATRSGVAPAADIVAIQIFTRFSGPSNCPGPHDPCLLAFTSDVVAGIDFARNLPGIDVDVVNLSLAGGQHTSSCDADDPPMTAGISSLLAEDIVTVASAGNDGSTNAIGSPACIEGVISVGASTVGDGVWSSSNSASFLDLLAPGVGIDSATPAALNGGSLWKNQTGTSVATPHVAGAIAALRGAAPDTSSAELLFLLQLGGVPITDGKSGITTPRIDVAKSLLLLAPAECWNGQDDDGDGEVDFPDDAGCLGGFGREAPACEDGLDNDGDGGIDFAGGPAGQPADAGCASPSDRSESAGFSCGLGVELLVLLPGLAWLRRRRG